MCSPTIARRSSGVMAASASSSPWIRNRNFISTPLLASTHETNARPHHRRMLAENVSATSDLLAAPLDELLAEAQRLRRGPLVTYSPKVFVPLTTLCRDVCGYCTF